MDPLDLVKLHALMEQTSGRPEVMIGLIDGPVAVNHLHLAEGHIREAPGREGGTCVHTETAACLHGTFVAGILFAKRNSPAPAICPNCTLFVYPVTQGAASRRNTVVPPLLDAWATYYALGKTILR